MISRFYQNLYLVFFSVDSQPNMTTSAYTPPPNTQPHVMPPNIAPPPNMILQRPQSNFNMTIPMPSPANMAMIRAQRFLTPNTMVPPPQSFHPLPSKPPANFTAPNMPPYFPVNMNYQHPKFSPPNTKSHQFSPQQNINYMQHQAAQMSQLEPPKKDSNFIPSEGFPLGHVQELSQYFSKLTRKPEETNQQMTMLSEFFFL